MPRISLLPAAGPITGAELLVCVQGGVTKQTTVTAVVAGGGGGAGPTWLTPIGGNLVWAPTTGPAGRVDLADNGVLFLQGQPGSVVTFTNAAVVEFNMVYGAGVMTFGVGSGSLWNMTTTGGGSVICNDATNAWQEQGFAITFRCWVAPNAGYWGGAGVPTSLEQAVDRIAAVVSAGGTTPIP